MNLNEYVHSKVAGRETTPDSFEDIVNDFLTKVDVNMLIRRPEGTQEPEIWDNINAGPVVRFYMVLAAIPRILLDMKALTEIIDMERFTDSVLQMIKDDIMKTLAEGKEK